METGVSLATGDIPSAEPRHLAELPLSGQFSQQFKALETHKRWEMDFYI